MIARLVEDGKVSAEGFQGAEGIFRALLGTHLLDRRAYPLHSIDPTIRHVLSLCLREEHPQRLEQINAWCVGYFWDALQNSGEDLQRAYVREWLFHRTIQLDVEKSPQEIRDLLKDDLKQITLRSTWGEGAREKLVTEMMADGELRGLLIKYLETEGFSALLQELAQIKVQG